MKPSVALNLADTVGASALGIASRMPIGPIGKTSKVLLSCTTVGFFSLSLRQLRL